MLRGSLASADVRAQPRRRTAEFDHDETAIRDVLASQTPRLPRWAERSSEDGELIDEVPARGKLGQNVTFVDRWR